jgi:site-specific recombinase XerD
MKHDLGYIEQLCKELAPQTVKQHLAVIRMMFDYFVVGQLMLMNPASSVGDPHHSIKKRMVPVLIA